MHLRDVREEGKRTHNLVNRNEAFALPHRLKYKIEIINSSSPEIIELDEEPFGPPIIGRTVKNPSGGSNHPTGSANPLSSPDPILQNSTEAVNGVGSQVSLSSDGIRTQGPGFQSFHSQLPFSCYQLSISSPVLKRAEKLLGFEPAIFLCAVSCRQARVLFRVNRTSAQWFFQWAKQGQRRG